MAFGAALFTIHSVGGIATAGAPEVAPPASTPELRQAEAAERFDRAMALLREGDRVGALAELTRVYALAPHPQVLFNLGLIHAALGHPVEATRTLTDVLADPGPLPPESLRLARRTRDEQARRVGFVEVITNVPANIEIDGIDVGKTPLSAPLAVAEGTRVISALSAGNLPLRKEVTVAGGAKQILSLDLIPSQVRTAHLFVRSHILDAEVMVDGQRVGRTPLASSLALSPGHRVVTLRRPGYVPAAQEITLDEGATGDLTLDLHDDPADAKHRGRLAITTSEPAEVMIDGRPRGDAGGPVTLPAGPHQLMIERAGFLPVQRVVTIPEQGETSVTITLTPTPETRDNYKAIVRSRRNWGWVLGIAGTGIAVAAGVLVAVNRPPLNEARAEIARLAPMFDFGQYCGADLNHRDEARCQPALDAADANFNRHQTLQNMGFIGIAVGSIAAAVGTVILVTAPDPARYDGRPPQIPSPSNPLVVGWLTPAGGGFAVGARY